MNEKLLIALNRLFRRRTVESVSTKVLTTVRDGVSEERQAVVVRMEESRFMLMISGPMTEVHLGLAVDKDPSKPGESVTLLRTTLEELRVLSSEAEAALRGGCATCGHEITQHELDTSDDCPCCSSAPHDGSCFAIGCPCESYDDTKDKALQEEWVTKAMKDFGFTYPAPKET